MQGPPWPKPSWLPGVGLATPEVTDSDAVSPPEVRLLSVGFLSFYEASVIITKTSASAFMPGHRDGYSWKRCWQAEVLPLALLPAETMCLSHQRLVSDKSMHPN